MKPAQMAISTSPDFPSLLPAGFHLMTIAQLRDLCVTRFPASTSRAPIMNGLERLITEMVRIRIYSEVWVNGSFLTEKIDPEDSDIIVTVASDFVESCSPQQFALLGLINSNLKSSHLCDSYVLCRYPSGHSNFWQGEWLTAYWIKQFGFGRADQLKGMALIRTP